MAQKNLPAINKINCSMTWYSNYYYKYYKWLSSQNLYLLIFFNKILIKSTLNNTRLLWNEKESSSLYFKLIKIKNKRVIKHDKFKQYMTSYFLDLNSLSILYNVYYYTSLERFKKSIEFKQNKNKLNLAINSKNNMVFFTKKSKNSMVFFIGKKKVWL